MSQISITKDGPDFIALGPGGQEEDRASSIERLARSLKVKFEGQGQIEFTFTRETDDQRGIFEREFKSYGEKPKFKKIS